MKLRVFREQRLKSAAEGALTAGKSTTRYTGLEAARFSPRLLARLRLLSALARKLIPSSTRLIPVESTARCGAARRWPGGPINKYLSPFDTFLLLDEQCFTEPEPRAQYLNLFYTQSMYNQKEAPRFSNAGE